ncbi:MAG: zinc metallopeptidase [Pseudomonadota bacterium]
MKLVIIVGLIIALLAFLPGWWVKRVIREHGDERDDFPGTGAEFARHILDEMKLSQVSVELTEIGDHYDPQDKAVRLSPAHHDGRSLSAVVIAAHEVGHAMQDATAFRPLVARTKMARAAFLVQKVGGVVMLGAPILMIVTRSPAALFAELAAGVLILLTSVIMHAVTLPVEFDASFKRAMPVLEAGNYISERDKPAARKILRAAAFTYVAAAAMTLLDITRWARILLR